jgi:hypothetical protein
LEQPERLLGHLISFNAETRRITIELDFFDPEKQEMLELILKEKKSFAFAFWKPFRQSKSWGQLKKYYRALHKLLFKLGEYPDAEKVKALDDEFKKRVFNCDNLEFYGSRIPLLPSKSTMSWDDMCKMIQYVYDNYGVIIEDDMEIK